MEKYLRRRARDQQEIEQLYNKPSNRKLKYLALGAAGLSLALIVVSILLMDRISWKFFMFLRGCIGLFAIVFAIIVTILVYRVNKEHISNRNLK